MAAAASGRIISLDGEWQFQIDGESAARTIRVPGPWEGQYPELRDRPVTATYTRTAKVPASWKTGVVRLHVGAADYYSEVSVNGFLVGVHEGGYTPFDLEVQEFLRPGEENVIQIKVTDGAPVRQVSGQGALTPVQRALENARPFPFTEIPHGKQSWYGTVGGIWQSVWLERRPDIYIDNVFVRPDVARQGASIRVRLAHPPLDPTGYAIHLVVREPKGAGTVAPVETPLPGARQATLNLAVSLPDPLLWDTENPHLYNLTVELRYDGTVIDSFDTRFGMRTIEARDGNILLNGHPVFIAGALDQDYYPGSIYTAPSTAFLKDQFRKAKEMGLNLLRCHIKTPDPRYLDLCDEMGIMVWYEIPNWAVLTKKSGSRGRRHLEAMLERDYNHACLLILSVMNESWGIDLTDKSQREWLVDMFDYAKSLDPTRIIVDNSACSGNYHVKSDLDDYHIYFSVPDHAKVWEKWLAEFAARPAWTYSRYGDAQRTKKEPILLSEFGNWGLPKPSLLRKCYGGEDPWWFKTGAGATRPEGCEERFLQYRLDRVFGTYDDMAEVSQEQEFISLKFEIEEMRKHSSIVGYVITEFTDLNWESNGLLDMCRNPKVFHRRLAPLQAQDLVIPDHKRTAFWGGERFAMRVLLSHFSRRGLAGATLHWTVQGFGKEMSGEIPLGDAPRPIGRSDIGEIAFRVPDVDKVRDAVLRLRLIDADGTEVNVNSEKLTFFPASARDIVLEQPVYIHDPLRLFSNAAGILKEAGVRLADHLEQGVVCLASRADEKLLHFVQHGGTALLVALDRESLPRTTSGLASIGRDKNGWWGDWCSNLTWFRPDGAEGEDCPWTGLPQTRQFDFTFRDVVPRRVLVGWDAQKDADDIWAGLFIGWVHFPATLAGGFRYGKGKVLATTFELFKSAKTDPVSVVLLGGLLNFAASPKFAPTKAVDMIRVELSNTLISTAEAKGTTWRYVTRDPGGDWTAPDFDDSTWKTGRSGFGRGLDQATARTRWSTADIYLRLAVDVPAEGITQATLSYFHDDDVEIFVNGHPLFARAGYTTDYEDVALSPEQVALFRPGRNVIAVYCQNHDGPQFVDIGITYETPQSAAASLSGNGQGGASESRGTSANARAATSGMAMAEEKEEGALQGTE